MKNKPSLLDKHVSASEIAKMTGFSPSAVSNWRVRHEDFPDPVGEGPHGDRFNLGSVVAWLERADKKYDLSVIETRVSLRWLKPLIEALREGREDEDALILCLQLLTIQDWPELDLWSRMVDEPGGALSSWRSVVEGMEDSAQDLKALRPSDRLEARRACGPHSRNRRCWTERVGDCRLLVAAAPGF